MRIRNRPTPSIFPPPPDLNFNRSFPPPPRPVQEPAADHQHATAPHHPRTLSPSSSALRIAVHSPPRHLPLPANSLPPQRRSGAGKSSSTTASSDSDDNDDDDNDNITRKGRSMVQEARVSHAKVESGWDGGTARAIQVAADTEDSGKRVKGTEKEESLPLPGKGAAKKRGPRVGAAIMEGSRCSRVNGRGWRCGQQTLVGYSLCEHHLGKSRLRSLTSVKSTSKHDHAVAVTLGTSSKRERRAEGSDDNHDDDDDDEALLVSGRKKSKIGTVKARSLSSLLGQTSQTSNGVPHISAAHEKQPCS
uniref:WRC domain-containing protein n=1 Tax=Kalanchoe fedtschenkoi TaxID=63787 RepID=A0A7N0RFM4_KALFE